MWLRHGRIVWPVYGSFRDALKPQNLKKSGISGLSGLWTQKSGALPKVRNIVVLARKRSGMDRDRSEMSENDIFRSSVWKSCLRPSAYRKASVSNTPLFSGKEWQLDLGFESEEGKVYLIKHHIFSFTRTTAHPAFHINVLVTKGLETLKVLVWLWANA